MAGVSIAKQERTETALKNTRNKLREGARLASNSLITSMGGGVAAGFCNAKYPTLLGTGVPTTGAIGAVLVFASMTGYLDEYSDEAAALGAGMLAVAVSDEAEKYFAT
jgi:hypothetical protein